MSELIAKFPISAATTTTLLGSIVIHIVIKKFFKSKDGNNTKKQGAYGKVKVHQPSILSAIFSPTRLVALYNFYNIKSTFKNKATFLENVNISNNSQLEADLKYCEKMLSKVSRSFALVIKFLPNDSPEYLRISIGVFYLVLRVLDTVEDDMDLTKFENLLLKQEIKYDLSPIEFKELLLLSFYKRLDLNNNSNDVFRSLLKNLGEGDEEDLLNNFDSVIRVISILPKNIQDIIQDITKEMGYGMSQYISRNLKNGTKDEDEFFLYCHYVAGLVGDGLTKIFIETDTIKLKDTSKDQELYESMGQFLQRTNILRDYLEDFVDGRAFWPRQVWKKFSKGNENLGIFANKDMIQQGYSTRCLNELIYSTLVFLPDNIEYLARLTDERVFAFCAVPQVMALYTLESCFNNKKVFTGVVKMHKADSAKILLKLMPKVLKGEKEEEIDDFTQGELYQNCMKLFVESIKRIRKINSKIKNDPSSKKIDTICGEVLDILK